LVVLCFLDMVRVKQDRVEKTPRKRLQAAQPRHKLAGGSLRVTPGLLMLRLRRLKPLRGKKLTLIFFLLATDY